MKKWTLLLVCFLILGLCAACGNAEQVTDYELPFSVEDISAITIGNGWEEITLEAADTISAYVDKLNEIQIYTKW